MRPIGLLALVGLFAACTATPEPEPPIKPAPEPEPEPRPLMMAAGDPGEQGEAEWGIVEPPPPNYAEVVRKVAGMVRDREVSEGARRRGLNVVNVMWEDTGRAQGSALGPNITDLTLQVRHEPTPGEFQTALMPVIRFPNFTDRTGDVRADRFLIRVGNHQEGKRLETVPLADVLRQPGRFVSLPASLAGTGSLMAPRDSHFLVSAQAVFLPIPQKGAAEFNPVVFNYQSAPRSPAVLTLLVTRQGTSIRVIDHGRDKAPSGWGQELYFNNGGQRAAFTAERRSDVQSRIEAQGGPQTDDDRSALARGADVLFLVQVPLVHEQRGRLGGLPSGAGFGVGGASKGASAPAPPAMRPRQVDESSDVEQAVLGHGPNLGPYEEGIGKRLVRDARFPIRITVQFYKATSNGVVDDKDLDGIAKSIGGVFEHADFVGSLVIPEGDPRRPTEWQRFRGEWFPW